MTSKPIGTPGTPGALRVMLLGSGELGKEVAIEALRYGLEVFAIDRYPNAPAMQVAQHAEVIDMLDGDALETLVERIQPDFIVPEVEAIATATLLELEGRGYHVVPTARAARLTMDREGIRRLAAEELQLPTTPYKFAFSERECWAAIEAIGIPCVVKPVMSSSGKGQVVVKEAGQAEDAWGHAIAGGRGSSAAVIVEGFIDFDYEITLLTVRHSAGTTFCAPIGHLQVDGDYRESWQPQAMPMAALAKAQDIAGAITASLGGHGVFGVELFVRGDSVYFNEVSPRPHDTGMVTLISQELSEFALHVRAILGFPIPNVIPTVPSASIALIGTGTGSQISYLGVADALQELGTEVRIFGKPEVSGHRRLGVMLARADSVSAARQMGRTCAAKITIEVN
ncbi:MAG: phosphoribosylglycinamide formyltransferase 2 [Gammaproteobacteria bacterium]|jgi:phosphoribosylglycinamide formyltransferase 2